MSILKQINRYENEQKKLWLEQNCLSEENLEYIRKVLLKPFKIKEIPTPYGGEALLLEYNLNTYRIEIDKDNMCLRLGKRNMVSNPKGLEHYHPVTKAGDESYFYGVDCFYDIIDWIAKKG
jgi:hypothetical protein